MIKIKLLFRFVSYLTFRKTLLFIIANISYLLTRFRLPGFVIHQPWFVSVEAAAFCNLRCPECPTGLRVLSRTGNSVFDTDLFRQFIDSKQRSLLHVILYFQGEPILHPQLPEMISYAHTSRIFTSISTNGQLITSVLAKALVESGLDKIIFSADGATQEVYQQYRVGGKLEKVKEAIRLINYWKADLHSITPMVELQMVVFSSNEHQLDAMRAMGRELSVNRVVFKTAQLYNFESGHHLMTTLDRFSRYKRNSDGRYVLKNKMPNRCWRLWNGAVVNVKGEVLPCCYDKNSEYSFGSIREHGFDTIWHNSKASGFRQSVLKNRKQFEICRNCTGK